MELLKLQLTASKSIIKIQASTHFWILVQTKENTSKRILPPLPAAAHSSSSDSPLGVFPVSLSDDCLQSERMCLQGIWLISLLRANVGWPFVIILSSFESWLKGPKGSLGLTLRGRSGKSRRHLSGWGQDSAFNSRLIEGSPGQTPGLLAPVNFC